MTDGDLITRRTVLRTGGAAVLATAAVSGCDQLTAARRDPKPTATRANRSDEEIVVAAAGDIACPPQVPPHQGGCGQTETAKLITTLEPDAVLALGDLQYEHGTMANFHASYDRSWGRFKDITYPVLGNHEFAADGTTGYFDYFGERAGASDKGYYSFDLGAWHFIALNTECHRVEGGCGSDSPQDQWLRADLDAHRDQPTLAFFHNPLFASGPPRGPSPQLRTFWRRLHAAGAQVVLGGNAHNYERFAPQDPEGNHDPERGITQFVVGTGGMNLSQIIHLTPNSRVHHDTSFGVLELVLRPRDFSWNFHSVSEGPVIDSGSQACH